MTLTRRDSSNIPVDISPRRLPQPPDSPNVVSSSLYREHPHASALSSRGRRRRHMSRLRERVHLSQQSKSAQFKQKSRSYSHLYLYFHHLSSTKSSRAFICPSLAVAQNQAHRPSQPQVPQRSHLATQSCCSPCTSFSQSRCSQTSWPSPKSRRRRSRSRKSCIGSQPFDHDRPHPCTSTSKPIHRLVNPFRYPQEQEPTIEQESTIETQRQEEVAWQRRYRSSSQLPQFSLRQRRPCTVPDVRVRRVVFLTH